MHQGIKVLVARTSRALNLSRLNLINTIRDLLCRILPVSSRTLLSASEPSSQLYQPLVRRDLQRPLKQAMKEQKRRNCSNSHRQGVRKEKPGDARITKTWRTGSMARRWGAGYFWCLLGPCCRQVSLHHSFINVKKGLTKDFKQVMREQRGETRRCSNLHRQVDEKKGNRAMLESPRHGG